MTFYLKNTSGSLVNVIDLGISLPDDKSLVIDSNGINAYLTSDLQFAITSGNLLLSTTDIGDNGGDMSVSEAIEALSITSRFDKDNPHSVTITQAIEDDSTTDISISELNELTDGGTISLHDHDDRYYTETELGSSNTGTVNVHWDNVTNAPSFGSLEWQTPAIGNLIGKGTGANTPGTADEGQYYLNEDDDHLYRYESSTWVDQGNPVIGDRVIFKDGVGEDDKIYEWNGTTWDPDPVPEDNWAIMVSDDGDGKAAQYVYDTTGLPPDWIKIADVDWGSHNALGGRDEANSHPGIAITFDPTGTDLTSTDIQNAIKEISTEQGVDLDNIVFVAKNGIDIDPNVTLGTIANPYLTIQAAIDSIAGASSTNRYIVYVMPGDFEENVILNKSFVYLTGPSKGGSRIISSNGTTLTLSSTTEFSTGINNMSVISNSSTTTDNAILITGNNPQLFNVDVNSPSGARTIYVNGAYEQTFRHVDLKNGEFRVDAGVVDFYDSQVIEGLTNITSGTLRVHNGNLSHNGGDSIKQSGGTIYLVSAKLISGTGSKDFNQLGGTVYWGWVEYDKNKVTFNGTKYILFGSTDISYDITGDTNITQNNIGDVISEIDTLITNILNANSSHEGDTTNPHDVTFTQVVAEDSGTDITVAEAETLTDGSNADLLHVHDSESITYDNSVSGLASTNVETAINELDSRLDASEHGYGGIVYVDQNRTDIYVPDGSAAYPYKNIVDAAVVAVAGQTIKVSEGNYTGNVVLPNQVSLVGAGIARTYITGDITTGTAKLNLEGFSAHNADITILGNAVVEDVYSSSKVTVNAPSGGVTGDNFTVEVGTGNAIVLINGGVSLTNGSVTSGDDTAIYQQDGSLTLDAVRVTGTHLTNPAIDSTGGVISILQASVVNAGGGPAISADNEGSTMNPNMLSDVAYVGEINMGSAVTISEGTHDLTGTVNEITGTAISHRPGEQIEYDPSTTPLTSTDVQGALTELSSLITSFEMPSGTVFPTSPAPDGGDIFYRTDINTTFQYDNSRSKWLSMTQMFLDWGSNVADGKYLNIHGATATQTGYLMPYSGTIISLTCKIASGNQSKGVEIRRNNDRVTPLESFNTTSGTYSSTTTNVDFAAGDYIQAFVPSAGTPAKDIVVMAVVVWSY